ncbi:MAG: hypothetical protein RR677_05475 [Acinetobacter sp.]
MRNYQQYSFPITSRMLNIVSEISEILGALSVHGVREWGDSNLDSIDLNKNTTSLNLTEMLYGKLRTWNASEIDDFFEAFALISNSNTFDSSIFYSNERQALYNKPLLYSSIYKDLNKFLQSNRNCEIHPLVFSSYFNWLVRKNQLFKNKDFNDLLAQIWQSVILINWRPIFSQVDIFQINCGGSSNNSKQQVNLLREVEPILFIESNLMNILKMLTNPNPA